MFLPPFFRIQDLVDILIMTFLLYQLYSWFRNTRAMQVLLGLGMVVPVYFVTRYLDLYMTSWILQELGTVLVVLLIVVFQGEIRQALYRISLLRTLFEPRGEKAEDDFRLIADTLFRLAGQRVGALVVFERSELDGRRHSPWVLTATVSEQGAASRLDMTLHYGGALWTGGVLERVLADQITSGRERLAARVRATH